MIADFWFRNEDLDEDEDQDEDEDEDEDKDHDEDLDDDFDEEQDVKDRRIVSKLRPVSWLLALLLTLHP
ncbi:hypothetical protein [Psychroflexus sediminis]|uniref:Uncharacterized protein n=1 Tax=Psychroflexus sediminis TaxID=470826 RepID=A0A1G7V8S1_9FLAO|nr:hypothetical protein [Psychroflexus sediminis]SDG56186.1 hypothetical protein SAMN04488027_103158 [Psychroflexus sediminis]